MFKPTLIYDSPTYKIHLTDRDSPEFVKIGIDWKNCIGHGFYDYYDDIFTVYHKKPNQTKFRKLFVISIEYCEIKRPANQNLFESDLILLDEVLNIIKTLYPDREMRP